MGHSRIHSLLPGFSSPWLWKCIRALSSVPPNSVSKYKNKLRWGLCSRSVGRGEGRSYDRRVPMPLHTTYPPIHLHCTPPRPTEHTITPFTSVKGLLQRRHGEREVTASRDALRSQILRSPRKLSLGWRMSGSARVIWTVSAILKFAPEFPLCLTISEWWNSILEQLILE
jgi:hypothetical protein